MDRELTPEEIEELNRKAKETCAFEMTSQIGE